MVFKQVKSQDVEFKSSWRDERVIGVTSLQNIIGKVCQINNSVIYSGKSIEPEEFLNRMVEVLDIIYR